MSRAFSKESDGQELDELPERPVSPHRNLVTPRGLQQIEDAVRELRAAASAARTASDRSALQLAERDLRYWTQRLASAELVPAAECADAVRFGCRVTMDVDGKEQTYVIVGEDESDPKAGRISYVTPIATALLGARVGDVVRLGAAAAEITAIR
jgi:transcription elongation GreA/GreB family factor